MRTGGNLQCREFLEQWEIYYDVEISKENRNETIKERYESPPAELYREVLKARMEGRPEPTELPERKEPAPQQSVPMKMEGFGSSPHPSEIPKKKKKNRAAMLAKGAKGVSSKVMAHSQRRVQKLMSAPRGLAKRIK